MVTRIDSIPFNKGFWAHRDGKTRDDCPSEGHDEWLRGHRYYEILRDSMHVRGGAELNKMWEGELE